MHPDLSKAYEVLGVKPGVSMRELKAAHRDLAKVWHPDRFLHDPRLQEKAQEKLKEINEAYEQISSGKVARPVYSPVTPPPRAPQTGHHATTTARHGSNWQWAVIFLLVFAAVFGITTRSLLQQRSQHPEEPQVEESANTDQAQPARPDSNTRAEVRNASQRSENEASEVTSPVSLPSEPVPAVETVTVTIDPETGLLAKPECPLRSRMTYPSGSQPTGYCNLSHAPPPKESRIKSIAKSVKRTLD